MSLAVAGAIVGSALALAAAPTVTIDDAGDGTATLAVTGLPDAWRSAWRTTPPSPEALGACASAHVAVRGRFASQAMAGRWRAGGDGLRFVPAFPLVAGLAHRVRLDGPCLASLAGDPGSAPWDGVFTADVVPPPAAAAADDPAPRAAPSLAAVGFRPAGGEVPENLLRVYRYFAAPQPRGDLYTRLAWRDVTDDGDGSGDGDGRATDPPHPFVEIEPELWDAGQRRVTLLLDPGRIKRGLRPHREAGVPLVAGHRYRLVLESVPPRGGPAATAVFTVVEADRIAPSIATWSVTPPAAGRRDAVVVAFPEPLDYGLLLRAIQVHDPRGAVLPGTAEVGPDQRSWRFVPAAPWAVGEHALVVETILEDLAGNSLRGLFDRDLRAGETENAAETVRLVFSPTSGSATP